MNRSDIKVGTEYLVSPRQDWTNDHWAASTVVVLDVRHWDLWSRIRREPKTYTLEDGTVWTTAAAYLQNSGLFVIARDLTTNKIQVIPTRNFKATRAVGQERIAIVKERVERQHAARQERVERQGQQQTTTQVRLAALGVPESHRLALVSPTDVRLPLASLRALLALAEGDGSGAGTRAARIACELSAGFDGLGGTAVTQLVNRAHRDLDE